MNKLKRIGQILDCFCSRIEFTKSHRREEVIPICPGKAMSKNFAGKRVGNTCSKKGPSCNYMQTVVASNDGNICNIYFDFVTNALMCLDGSGRRPRAVEIHLKCAFTRTRSNNRISRESDFLTTDDVFTMLIAIRIFPFVFD